MTSTSARAKISVVLFSAIAMFACLRNAGQDVTSTSVTTGNPTGIRILFRKDSNPVSLKGKIEIFAATQVPLPIYSPNPLLRIPISDSTNFRLELDALSNIADSLWPPSSIDWDSIYHFNLVISDNSDGVILQDFGFDKRKNVFKVPAYIEGDVDSNLTMNVNGSLGSLKKSVVTIDPRTLSTTKDQYLFIYGTGFYALGEKGRFEFPTLPEGAYDMAQLGIPGKDHTASLGDTLFVYGLSNKITSGTENSVSINGVIGSVLTPDSLRVKP